jgi:aminoglycoside 3-N-acetyltransferase I
MKLVEKELKIKRLSVQDIAIAQQLFLLLQVVFKVEKPTAANESYINRLLENTGFICLTVTYKNEVIGGLTAYELPMYDADRAELFIYDIAVKHNFQRMGLGKKLLTAIMVHCKAKGIKEIFVDAAEADKYALDFYRSVNGKEEKLIQFTFRN